MALKYTEEKLNSLDKETIIQLFLSQQEQLENIDRTLQLVLEQVADLKRHRFGRSSERHEIEAQISFMEVDGKIVFFNEAEAVTTEASGEEAETIPRRKPKKKQGKREDDLEGLPVVVIEHSMTQDELTALFGKEGFKQLPDEVYRRYGFTPAKVEAEEHHVKVYAGKKTDEIVRAPHPGSLLRGSLVSPSLEAAVINAKYVNAVPLYRQEQEFLRYGLHISRQNMANWTIQCADRYLAVMYDYLHKLLYGYHVLQADETPVEVTKDGRPAGARSYMWIYRTGRSYAEAIVLYEYQKDRKADHPEEFLKGFQGVCVTDGYQAYHSLEEKTSGLTAAGCWAHARRKYADALKAVKDKEKRKSMLAYDAIKQIGAIYKLDNELAGLKPAERQHRRQLELKPLVDAYFVWVKGHQNEVLPKSQTGKAFTYSINQERYLRVFLKDGEVPLDNNATESTLRGFCIGKHNWRLIDTVRGAKSSAIIYSITETAKANGLKVYDYVEHLLTEIPKHEDDTDLSFLDDLLPWSPNLPDHIRKSNKYEVK